MANLQKYSSFTIEDAEEAESDLAKLGSADFFKWQTGKNKVRFLPGRPGEKWAVITQRHFIKLPGGAKPAVFACPRAHAKRQCPGCSKVDELLATGNPRDADAAEDFKAKLNIFANIVDRRDPERGVRVVQFGKSIYDQLIAIRRNEDAGGDFTDPGPDGFDIIVEKKGSGLSTEYTVLAERKTSPLGNDEWLEQMYDLKRYAIVPSEEELRRKLSGQGRGGGGGAPERSSGAAKGRTAADDVMDVDD